VSHPLSGCGVLFTTFRLPALGAVAEWADEFDPLVMRDQSSGLFTTGTSGSVTSYDNVDDGG
jgi:hypothetical protein